MLFFLQAVMFVICFQRRKEFEIHEFKRQLSGTRSLPVLPRGRRVASWSDYKPVQLIVIASDLKQLVEHRSVNKELRFGVTLSLSSWSYLEPIGNKLFQATVQEPLEEWRVVTWDDLKRVFRWSCKVTIGKKSLRVPPGGRRVTSLKRL